MTRKLKALGLALVAVFAMGAVAASGASATSFHFNSNAPVEHTILSGSQISGFNHKFKTTAGEVTCENAEFSGTSTSNAAKDLTIQAAYYGCHIFVFSKVAAEVKMNGCEYTFTSHQTVGGKTEPFTVHVVCPEGKVVEVVAAGCTVKVGPQTLTGFEVTNVENHVKVAANSKNVSYSHTGFTCGTGSGTTGTYVGDTTVKGSTTLGAPVKVSYDVAP
jgi:hypothetical protein